MIHPSSALEVVDEGAEVEVDSATDAVIVVAEHVFGVDEARFVFIDFDAALDEGEVVGAGHEIDDFLVGNVRGDDFDVDALFGGEGKGVHDFAITNEIGSGDAEGFGGAVDEVEIDVFGDGLVVDGAGAGAIDGGEAAGVSGVLSAEGGLGFGLGLLRIWLRLLVWEEVVKGEGSFAMEVPRREEEGEEVGDGGASEANTAVLPVAMEGFEVGIFVGEVDAAGVADLAVDDGDFAVVTVVMKAIDAGVKFVRGDAMNAESFEFVVVAGGESKDAAEIVIHDVDFDAFLDFFLEDGEDLAPDMARADNEVFEENVFLGGFQVEEKLRKIGFTVGKISGLVVLGKGNVVGFANIAGLESGDRICFGEFFEGGVF